MSEEATISARVAKRSVSYGDVGTPCTREPMVCTNGIKPDESGHDTQSPPLSLSREEHCIRIAGERLRVTRTEFRLLAHLIEHRLEWVTPAALIHDVLGTYHRPDTPLVRVHIHAVRRKLGRYAQWVETDPHRVRGYRWIGPSHG